MHRTATLALSGALLGALALPASGVAHDAKCDHASGRYVADWLHRGPVIFTFGPETYTAVWTGDGFTVTHPLDPRCATPAPVPPVPEPVPGPTPAPVPTTPEVVPEPPVSPPVLRTAVRVAKTGPARLRSEQRGTYVIRVRNVGSTTLSGLLLRDLLPRGLAVRKGARLVRAAVVWNLPTLAPGASAVRRLRVVALRGPSRRVCNRAQVLRGSRVLGRDRACTRLVYVPLRRTPAVTG